MVNVVFVFLKVQVLYTSTLRMQIINQCDNFLAVVVDSVSLSGS